MTSYEKPKVRPEVGRYHGFHHIEFFVSNAKQIADWYVLRFGFERVAYKGLETGSRKTASHVVRQNKIFFVFTSELNPKKTSTNEEVLVSGDFARDVAFQVDDARGIYEKAVKRGAKSVQAPVELKDEFGSVVRASVQTYGNVVHSFIQRNKYKGVFLPGFDPVTEKDPLSALLSSPQLQFIDHVVGNQPDLKMNNVCDWYSKCLDFHRFWSVDDKQLHTKYSALRSVVMADFDEKVKMPINEPAKGVRKSQIQEFVDYHGGAGVQHVALNTSNILNAITVLRKRGMKFLDIPKTYYEDLRKRLAKSKVEVKEDLDEIQKRNILIDFDDKGYLLQIFTKPVADRPTLFFEVIQRNNHQGFGAGNFKSLFQAIERDQKERGNL